MVPDRFKEVVTLYWDDFDSVVNRAPRVLNALIDDGISLLLKGAFDPNWMWAAQTAVSAWTRSRPDSFHKILDGVPDFHRKIDPETGKKYSILGCKHSSYFFRWNDDPCQLWEETSRVWGTINKLLGTDYSKNKPSDGPTDRIQIVRYPPGTGFLEQHRDASEHQRVFISGYMSKRGIDYTGGGFYLVDKEGRKNYLEDQIDVGDVCIGHANLLHGVDPSDGSPDEPINWDSDSGRWFFGMYSNPSDYEKNRHTAKKA